MTDRSSKEIVNFPGGDWHSRNEARKAAIILGAKRRGITYGYYLKEPGEIIQRADSSSGASIGRILIVTGFRIDNENCEKPPSTYIQTVQLQENPGELTYDPTQRLELPEDVAIRRSGRLTGPVLEKFLEPYHKVDERIRRLQTRGYSNEEIITTLSQEPKVDRPLSAFKLLKDAFRAIVKGRIF